MRLRRLKCGKAQPFRQAAFRTAEASPRAILIRHSLNKEIKREPERQSLSAHRTAQPQ
jgi:hypothetical protein